MDTLFDWIKKPFSLLVGLFSAFFFPLLPIVGLIIGVIANPGGALNALACRIIDIVAFPFPTSPPSIKLVSIITSLGNAIPFIGSAILFDFAQTFVVIMLIYIGIKVYKLLPFKMS